MPLFNFGGNNLPPEPIGNMQQVENQEHVPFYQMSQQNDLGKVMLETDSLVQRLRLELLGFIETNPGEWTQLGDPEMNQKGAAEVSAFIGSLDHKHTFLGKIDEYDKVRIAKNIWMIMIKAIVKNKTTWGLRDDPSSWSRIRAKVVENIYIALSRGQDGTEKRFFSDTHQSKTVSNAAAQSLYRERNFWS